MVRARMAWLALAGCLSVSTGCSSSMDFLHLGRSRGNGNCFGNCSVPLAADFGDCGAPCCDTPCFGGACSSGPFLGGGFVPGGPPPVISNGHPPLEGPNLFAPSFPPSFPPSPTPLPPGPGVTMPLAGPLPRPAPMPPIITVPQAVPSASPP
jgi:hypothetical protein